MILSEESLTTRSVTQQEEDGTNGLRCSTNRAPIRCRTKQSRRCLLHRIIWGRTAAGGRRPSPLPTNTPEEGERSARRLGRGTRAADRKRCPAPRPGYGSDWSVQQGRGGRESVEEGA